MVLKQIKLPTLSDNKSSKKEKKMIALIVGLVIIALALISLAFATSFKVVGIIQSIVGGVITSTAGASPKLAILASIGVIFIIILSLPKIKDWFPRWWIRSIAVVLILIGTYCFIKSDAIPESIKESSAKISETITRQMAGLSEKMLAKSEQKEAQDYGHANQTRTIIIEKGTSLYSCQNGSCKMLRVIKEKFKARSGGDKENFKNSLYVKVFLPSNNNYAEAEEVYVLADQVKFVQYVDEFNQLSQELAEEKVARARAEKKTSKTERVIIYKNQPVKVSKKKTPSHKTFTFSAKDDLDSRSSGMKFNIPVNPGDRVEFISDTRINSSGGGSISIGNNEVVCVKGDILIKKGSWAIYKKGPKTISINCDGPVVLIHPIKLKISS